MYTFVYTRTLITAITYVHFYLHRHTNYIYHLSSAPALLSLSGSDVECFLCIGMGFSKTLIISGNTGRCAGIKCQQSCKISYTSKDRKK